MGLKVRLFIQDIRFPRRQGHTMGYITSLACMSPCLLLLLWQVWLMLCHVETPCLPQWGHTQTLLLSSLSHYITLHVIKPIMIPIIRVQKRNQPD